MTHGGETLGRTHRLEAFPAVGARSLSAPGRTGTSRFKAAEALTNETDAPKFEDFYFAHFKTVYEIAWAFSGSRDIASDAAQEAFARAFSRWSRLSDDASVGWVVTTALNLCRRSLRRRRREPSLDLAPTVSAPSPRPDRVDLVNALRRLPTRRRMAAVLFYLGDHSVGEVAALMNLSEGAVKAHLHFARTSLKAELDETRTDDKEDPRDV